VLNSTLTHPFHALPSFSIKHFSLAQFIPIIIYNIHYQIQQIRQLLPLPSLPFVFSTQ